MKSTALLLCVLSSALVAQTPAKPAMPVSKPDTKAKSPVISDVLKKNFYKTQLELKQAQDTLSQKQQAAQVAGIEISQACGPNFNPQLDPATNEPVCVEKPKSVEPTKK